MDNIKMASFSKVDDNLMQIPPELMQFVKRDTYSLLVKGNSGTGKTTLSLTILRALEIRSNFFYISTRLSPRQLFVNYPWMEKFVVRENIEVNDPSNQRSSLSSFEDARLDEPESLFERITNQLMDVKAPIIIIDSWDAIASFMDKEARLNNERVLQTWRERAGAKLIFISEDPKDTTLDFLVDGIIELGQKYCDSIRIREIFLSKLRGVMINKPTYIYSLNNGIFRSYDTYKPAEFITTVKSSIAFNKIEHLFQLLPEDHYIASGYPELDIALGGGFPKKSVILIELDSDINARIIMTFLARIMSNFVRMSSPILLQPTDEVDPKAVMPYLEPYLSTNSERGLVKIFLSSSKPKGICDYNGTSRSKWDAFEKHFEFFHDVVTKTRQEHPNKLLLNVMGGEMFQKMHNYGEINGIDLMPFIKANTDLSIVVVRHSQDVGERLAGISDMHVRFTLINGTLFLQSLVPRTYLHAIVIDRSSGYPKIKLEPIV